MLFYDKIIQRTLNMKYLETEQMMNLFKINDLLKARNKHYVAVFTDHLIYGDINDFLFQVYSIKQAYKLLQEHNYTKDIGVLCYPNKSIQKLMISNWKSHRLHHNHKKEILKEDAQVPYSTLFVSTFVEGLNESLKKEPSIDLNFKNEYEKEIIKVSDSFMSIIPPPPQTKGYNVKEIEKVFISSNQIKRMASALGSTQDNNEHKFKKLQKPPISNIKVVEVETRKSLIRSKLNEEQIINSSNNSIKNKTRMKPLTHDSVYKSMSPPRMTHYTVMSPLVNMPSTNKKKKKSKAILSLSQVPIKPKDRAISIRCIKKDETNPLYLTSNGFLFNKTLTKDKSNSFRTQTEVSISHQEQFLFYSPYNSKTINPPPVTPLAKKTVPLPTSTISYKSTSRNSLRSTRQSIKKSTNCSVSSIKTKSSRRPFY